MSKHKAFKYLTIWFLVTQMIPMYSLVVPVHGAIDLAIYIGVTILLFPDLLKSKRVVWLIIYTAIMVVLWSLGNDFFRGSASFIVPIMSMYCGLLLCEYIFKYDETYTLTKTVCFLTVVFTVIMALISIPKVWLEPNIIRGASVYAAETSQGSSEAFWLINYGTIHGLSFIIAPLFFLSRKYFWKKKKFFYRILPFAALVIILYIIYLSQATTATLVAVMMVVASLLFYTQEINQKVIVRIIFVCLLGSILMTDTVMLGVLDIAQTTMNPSGSNYKKIDEMKMQVQYGSTDGDLGARQDLYNTSWDLFLESPLLGTSTPAKISRHTFFLDRLALLGIFLIIPLVMLFITHFRYIFENLHNGQVCYILGFGAFLMQLFLKNEFGAGTWFYGFALLPIFSRLMEYDNNN